MLLNSNGSTFSCIIGMNFLIVDKMVRLTVESSTCIRTLRSAQIKA